MSMKRCTSTSKTLQPLLDKVSFDCDVIEQLLMQLRRIGPTSEDISSLFLEPFVLKMALDPNMYVNIDRMIPKFSMVTLSMC